MQTPLQDHRIWRLSSRFFGGTLENCPPSPRTECCCADLALWVKHHDLNTWPMHLQWNKYQGLKQFAIILKLLQPSRTLWLLRVKRQGGGRSYLDAIFTEWAIQEMPMMAENFPKCQLMPCELWSLALTGLCTVRIKRMPSVCPQDVYILRYIWSFFSQPCNRIDQDLTSLQ